MQRKLWYLTLVGALLLSAAPVVADRDYGVPPGVGGEAGTMITRLPYTINNPGFYYIARNLSYFTFGTVSGITVASDDVTIDLMGFSLVGPGDNQGYAISLVDRNFRGHSNVEVRNGTLKGWSEGVHTANDCSNNRAIDLRTEDCKVAGISLQGAGDGNLIRNCTAVGSNWESVGTGIAIVGGLATGNTVANSTRGIVGSGTISNNYVSGSSSVGIECLGACSVIGNTVVAVAGTPKGIDTDTGKPAVVTQNTVSGPGTHYVSGAGTLNVPNTNAGF